MLQTITKIKDNHEPVRVGTLSMTVKKRRDSVTKEALEYKVDDNYILVTS